MSIQNDSITLLLLQITLYRQQDLVHSDSSLNLDELLVEPIVDESVVEAFVSHKLVKLHAQELTSLNKITTKALITDIFKKTQIEGPKNLITLANYYYSQRLNYLEKEKIPELISLIKQSCEDQSK